MTPAEGPRLLVLEHDPSDPPKKLGDWLTEAGATLHVLRLHAGDPLPDGLAGYDGIVSLGGEMGAADDDLAPWLPGTRALLAAAAAAALPTLAICLGAQLLAAATGGVVARGGDGPEIGAYLTAKRDASFDDPLCADLPMTPDVMHYHQDVVATLPPGAVLLLSSQGYPHQAWRLGPAAWGLQFHIECAAEDVRDWARAEGRPLTGRLGPMLDAAETEMAEVWREFVERFVGFARRAPDPDPALMGAVAGRRLPLVPG